MVKIYIDEQLINNSEIEGTLSFPDTVQATGSTVNLPLRRFKSPSPQASPLEVTVYTEAEEQIFTGEIGSYSVDYSSTNGGRLKRLISVTCKDNARHLKRVPIFHKFNDTLRGCLDLALTLGECESFIGPISYLLGSTNYNDDIIPSANIPIRYDAKYVYLDQILNFIVPFIEGGSWRISTETGRLEVSQFSEAIESPYVINLSTPCTPFMKSLESLTFTLGISPTVTAVQVNGLNAQFVNNNVELFPDNILEITDTSIDVSSQQLSYEYLPVATVIQTVELIPNIMASLCPFFAVTGSPGGDDNQYYLLFTDPKYLVIGGSGIKINSATDDIEFPLALESESIFNIDLTDMDYLTVPSVSLSIASGIMVNSYEYSPKNQICSNFIEQFPVVFQILDFSPPPNQTIDLLNADDFFFEYTNPIYDNNVYETTFDVLIPRYSGFPANPFFFMRYTIGTNSPGARVQFQLGTNIIFDSDTDANGTYTTGFNAETLRGSFARFTLRVFLNTGGNNVKPFFIGEGDTDRYLEFDFPDPPDPPPTINATQKVFIGETQVVDLVSTGGNASSGINIDLRPYAGQVVQVKVQSSLTIDAISNFVVNAETRSDFTIDCADSEGPGGGSSGGSGGS